MGRLHVRSKLKICVTIQIKAVFSCDSKKTSNCSLVKDLKCFIRISGCIEMVCKDDFARDFSGCVLWVALNETDMKALPHQLNIMELGVARL